jgi:hypothetical protein
LYVSFWPLCCLFFFFDIRILITPLVSSSSSYILYQRLFVVVREDLASREVKNWPAIRQCHPYIHTCAHTHTQWSVSRLFRWSSRGHFLYCKWPLAKPPTPLLHILCISMVSLMTLFQYLDLDMIFVFLM